MGQAAGHTDGYAARMTFRLTSMLMGLSGETIAVSRFRTLNRLINWAKSSPLGEHFAARFAAGGAAAEPDKTLPLSGGSASCPVASTAETGFTEPRTLASTG
jgi:hypothetical protein